MSAMLDCLATISGLLNPMSTILGDAILFAGSMSAMLDGAILWAGPVSAILDYAILRARSIFTFLDDSDNVGLLDDVILYVGPKPTIWITHPGRCDLEAGPMSAILSRVTQGVHYHAEQLAMMSQFPTSW